jgi:periplasmic protein TonB
MKNLFFGLWLWSGGVLAQSVEEDKIFTVAETMPQYPGGAAALQKFLQKNIRNHTTSCHDQKLHKLFITFVIHKDGKVRNFDIINVREAICKKEITDHLRQMPEWKPGLQNAQPVNVRYTVVFEVTPYR